LLKKELNRIIIENKNEKEKEKVKIEEYPKKRESFSSVCGGKNLKN